jgi:hypothetical protein
MLRISSKCSLLLTTFILAGCAAKPIEKQVVVEPASVHRLEIDAFGKQRAIQFTELSADRLECYLVRAERAGEVEKLLLEGGKPVPQAVERFVTLSQSGQAADLPLEPSVGYVLLLRNTGARSASVRVKIG